jgi:hypothetical protein
VADVAWPVSDDAGDEAAGVDLGDAPAEPSDAAITPISAPPMATLTPAARIRPCMLNLRRAMPELSSRRVRVC